LKDLDFNDISYSVLKKNESNPIDKRIVIVNIGSADRGGLALLIEKIRAAEPTVIGLDVTFDGARETEKDSLLRQMIVSTSNLVVVSKINWQNKNEPEDIGYFGEYTHNRGYSNFIAEDGGTIRIFSSSEQINNKKSLSFPSAIMARADSNAYAELLERKNEYEFINYTRNQDQYMIVDGIDLLSGNATDLLFKGKIVLLGYISSGPYDIEDKHFTPLNTRFAGKSVPDMNGIVIHANILSMILDRNYIHYVPGTIYWFLTILIAWLHVALFMRYYIEQHIWFHLVAKLAQIFFSILSVYFGILCFDWFNLILDTKSSLIIIILAVDIIYFYEAFAVWLHQKFGFQTNFHSKSH